MRLGVSNGFLPEKTAVLEIDADNREPKDPFGVDVVVGSLGLFGNGKRVPSGNGAGKENSFSPNYRAGMSLVRQRNFPADVLGLVPVKGRIGMGTLPRSEWPSPLGPKVERFRLGL
jgi:hypothetical protein